MLRKACFFDFTNFKLYLEAVIGLNDDQVQAVYTSSFELGRITMIIGFITGLVVGAWVL